MLATSVEKCAIGLYQLIATKYDLLFEMPRLQVRIGVFLFNLADL